MWPIQLQNTGNSNDKFKITLHSQNRMKLLFWFFLAFLLCAHAQAQTRYDTESIMRIPVQLDTFVFRSGFEIKAFMRRVQNDTTFYKAFKSMHLVPFTSKNSFTVYDNKGNVTATCNNTARQLIDNRKCRTTQFKDQTITGDFLKKDGSYNYFTAEMFFSLFFSKTPVCNQSDVVGDGIEQQGSSRMEKSKYELKQLMFNPGAKVKGVPLMGNKACIFDEGESYKYKFSVKEATYEGEDCYVFIVTPKPEYAKETVYNTLTTWFRRSDYSILARDYSLSFSRLFYDFDVKMKVNMKQMGNKLYPTAIHYDGNWHILTKKREHMVVDMTINY